MQTDDYSNGDPVTQRCPTTERAASGRMTMYDVDGVHVWALDMADAQRIASLPQGAP